VLQQLINLHTELDDSFAKVQNKASFLLTFSTELCRKHYLGSIHLHLFNVKDHISDKCLYQTLRGRSHECNTVSKNACCIAVRPLNTGRGGGSIARTDSMKKKAGQLK
jgi:hypothetical protein